MAGGSHMPLVTIKTKFQVTIPQEVREELGLSKGDLLEAKVVNGRIVLTPKELVDRSEAVKRWQAVAERVAEQLEEEGKTQEDLERLIEEEVEAVRAERYARQSQ
jgi:AbrB family looped-hinge helix DNA binding protein